MVDIPINESARFTTVSVTSPGQTAFDYDFYVQSADDVQVTRIDLDAVRTELVPGVDFSVTSFGALDGGSIAIIGVSLAVGEYLTIYSAIPVERQTDYTRDLFAAQINYEMDRIFMILQEKERDLSRAVKSSIGSATLNLADGLLDGETLMKQGALIVAGPNAADIASAQAYADAAEAAAADAVAAASSISVRVFETLSEAQAATIPEAVTILLVGGDSYVRIDPNYPGLGPELVTNGGFSSATGWTLGTGWSIAAGVASRGVQASSSAVRTTVAIDEDKNYLFSANVVSGGQGVYFQNGQPNTTGTIFTGTGVKHQVLDVQAGATFAYIYGVAEFAGSVDNFSVKSIPSGSINTADGEWWGPISTIAEVPTRGALKTIDTATKKVAVIYEDGKRNGTFHFLEGNFSTQIAADTQEGIYIKADDTAAASGAWVRQFVGLADVRWFGALLDDVANDTTAFNVALAVAKDVLFPEGRAYITDRIQVPNGGNLIGMGIGRSIFSIKSTFNMAATCVVKMGTSENSSLIDKIGFECQQPATGVRAAMNQYPYMIGHPGIPRVRIGHVRFSRAWNGIDASLNAGGATYDFVESGCLNRSLYIDGALDTMNVGRFRVWPFGIGPAGDGGTGDVYRDGVTRAALIGRCDGLAGQIQSFAASVEFNANGASSADRHLETLHLDGDGARLIVTAGPLDVSYLYSTKSAAEVANAILVQGGAVRIGMINIGSDALEIPILITSGSLQINGGRINHIRPNVRAAYAGVGAGALVLRNVELTAPGAFSAQYVRADAGEFIVQNCWFPGNGGTGVGILRAGTAVLTNTNNVLNGRTVTT